MTVDRFIRVSPPHSLIMVTTSAQPDVPLLDGALVASTRTCIAVGTLMELDGETEVRMIDQPHERHDLHVATEQVLSSDEGFVAVVTTDGRELLRQAVAEQTQRVRVWVSDPLEPDEIVLELLS